MVKSGHVAGNMDGEIPRLFNAAGLECTELAARRHPVMGRIAYYRAVRPAR